MIAKVIGVLITGVIGGIIVIGIGLLITAALLGITDSAWRWFFQDTEAFSGNTAAGCE